MELSVLVTGGLGFVGSAIVAAIEEQHPEWTISILDLHKPDNPQPYIAYYVCDITDQAQTEEVISKIKPAAVIHTAGVVPRWGDRYSRNHQERLFSINVEGTRNILTAAKSSNIKAFVWTGSCCAVTDDLSRQFPNIDERWPTTEHSLVYGESKASLNETKSSVTSLTQKTGCRRNSRPRRFFR